MIALLAILIALNIADVYLTLRILKQGGVEKNPFLKYFIEHYGEPEALVGIKVVIFLFLLAVWSHVTWHLLVGLNLFYVWVVWHNWKQLK